MHLEGGGHFGKKSYLEFENPSPIHISPQYLNPMYLNICSTRTILIHILIKKKRYMIQVTQLSDRIAFCKTNIMYQSYVVAKKCGTCRNMTL